MFRDEAVAQVQGSPSLPVPPAFLFCLAMEGPDLLEIFQRLGVDYARVLHAEQHFIYHRSSLPGRLCVFSRASGNFTAGGRGC